MATKKRRLNGDGSFKKRKNGLWEYMIVVPGQYDKTGKAIRISTYGKTQADCREKAKAKLNQYATGTVYAKDDVTIVQLAEQICKEKLDNGTTQKQSYERDLETVKRLEDIGNVPIQKVTAEQLQAFCNSKRTYSDSVLKKIYQMLRRVYREATERGIIPKNLMLKVTLPKSSKPKEDVRALTIDEEKRFLATLYNNEVKYAAPMLIMLFTGMRMGEVLALQVCDIQDQILHITKTVSRGSKGKPFVNSNAKTDAGRRDIRIGEDLRAYFAMLTDGKKPNDYLFTNGGDIIDANTVYTSFKQTLEQYDILDHINGKKVTQHSLRHTYATRCIESGMQAKVLQHRLGHKDITTTYNIYGDVFALYEDACIDTSDKYMKKNKIQLRYNCGAKTRKRR